MMLPPDVFVLALCLVGEAFFSGIETGVISVHRMRLRHFVRRGAAGADILESYLDNSDRLLGTTLVGTNLCMVILSVTAARLAVRHFGPGGEAVTAAAVALFVLVFCEYLPKTWFHSRALERSRRLVGVLRGFEYIFWPLSRVVIWASRILVPGRSGGTFAKPAPFVTRDDFKALIRDGERDGILSPSERVMLHRVFELSGKRADQIMAPLDAMTTASTETTLPEIRKLALASGFTRIPVYDPARESYVGVINIFFVLAGDGATNGRTVRAFMRPPLFVRDTMPVDDILPLMRRARQPMALVRDDAGAVRGLLTMDDILEEIVGQL